MITVCFLALCSLSLYVSAGKEILKNAGCDSKKFDNNWYCPECTLASNKKAKLSGKRCLQVKNRAAGYSGPWQQVSLTGNQRYTFTAHIRLINLAPGHMYHTASLKLTCNDAQGDKFYRTFGTVPFIFKKQWTKLGGTQKIPAVANDCKVYVQVAETEVDYYLDEASLKAVPDMTNWKTEAEARIEEIRKGYVILTLADNGANTENVEVELSQTRHKFAFGTAVAAAEITNASLTNLQNFVFDNFEWAVIGNVMKWGAMEKTQGVVDYDRPAEAIAVLEAQGMKIRGHNVVWGVEKHIQDWVKGLTKTELVAAIETRISDVITNTSGKLEHWDVNNENLHGDFYERMTEDPDITLKMFNDVNAIESDVKLFLNDYNVVTNGLSAMAIRNQGLRFQAEGAPIYGIGIQSHYSSSNIDLTTVQTRLDTVAEAGLPIWITELSVDEADPAVTAAALTDLYTLYFSHPSIEGVLLWGFWDGGIFKLKSILAEGPDVTPNAAGQAYIDLFHTTWRTNVVQPITVEQSIAIRAFKGDYSMKVKQNGSVVKTMTFTLDGDCKALTIDLTS